MTASGDDDGGIAVWPVHDEYGRRMFALQRVIVGSQEHRVFTQPRASANVAFIAAVQEAVRDVARSEDGLPTDDAVLRRFLDEVTQAEADYRRRVSGMPDV